jgi:hypothetical protein
MKIKLVEQVTGINHNTWLTILVMHLMTEHTSNAEKWNKVFGIKIEPGQPGEDEVDLKITINGVEVRFESFIKHLEETHGEMLEEAAKELISKRCQNLLNVVQDAERLLSDEIDKDFPGRTVW